MRCPICKNHETTEQPRVGSTANLSCPRCGNYKISDTEIALSNMRPSNEILSSWTREQTTLGDIPLISEETRILAQERRKPTYIERVHYFLTALVKEPNSWKTINSLDHPMWIAITRSKEIHEVNLMVEFLKSEGWLETVKGSGLRVSGKGLIKADELNNRSVQGIEGFVAMWFNVDILPAYQNGIKPAIEDAGYKAVRLDQHEHNNRIDDEIMSAIRRSKFLVVDFTGNSPGAYFESGFAIGLGKEVFWTCRRQERESLHFDIRQYNCIDWNTPADLRLRLSQRITGTLGDGPARRQQSGI